MAWHRCRHKQAVRSIGYAKKYPSKLNPLRILNSVWNFNQFLACLAYESARLIPVWIVEMFRFCPYKKLSAKEAFYIIGHRGADYYEVENTLPSFKKAIEVYGANALEMDLCFTADNEVVIWHDWDPDSIIALVRQMGLEPVVKYKPYIPDDGPMRKPVHKLTLSELRTNFGFSLKKKSRRVEAYIPTLREMMAWAVTEPRLKFIILDTKIPEDMEYITPTMMGKINDIIKEFSPSFTIMVMTPKKNIVQAMKKAEPQLNYTYDIELPAGIVLDPQSYSAINHGLEVGNHFASSGRPTVLELGPWTTYRRLIAYDMQQKAKYAATEKEFKKYIGWTINHNHELKCLVKMQVDGLVTDRPDRLKKILNKAQKIKA